MCVVGDSLARAFGLGAALSIVRFRTPVKNPLDTAFLFMSVAVGMASGVGAGVLALTAAGSIGLAALFLEWTSFGAAELTDEPSEIEEGDLPHDPLGLLRFRYRGSADERNQLSEIVGRHTIEFRLSGINSNGEEEEELVYDLKLHDDKAAHHLISDLREVGASTVSLLPEGKPQEA